MTKNKKEKKNKKEEILEKGSEEKVVVDEMSQGEEGQKTSFEKSNLKKKLEECEKEKQEYLDGWQRARAELVNLKKNHEEEKKLFTSIGKEKILTDLIGVLDHFNAAFNSEAWEKVDKNWRIGIEYIYKQFQDILEKNNIEEFGKVGDDLDLKHHEVVEEVEGEEKEKDKVVEVIQKGYKIGDKVVRSAKVKVGK